MKKLIVVAVLSIVGFAAWRWHDAGTTGAADDARILKDRVWVDHMPRNERDTANWFVVLGREPVGVFQAASAWRGAFEMFRYESSGSEMRVVFPQTGDREKLQFTARRCKESGMDFCLEISGSSRGVKRYYSKQGWEIRRIDDAVPLVEASVAH